jgi:predicted DNA-binding transcriptional regulator YafY
MRADRLLTVLLLLQAKGHLSSRELAERLEVSQRTVHRDMEALSAANVPVLALRGSKGGWQLDKQWRTQVPGLDHSELGALLMSQPKALGDSRLIAAAERALTKLVAALPDSMRQQAALMRERFHVDNTGWRAIGDDLSFLPAVQDAIARQCRLTFEYTRVDGEKAQRLVDPLGLVVKGVTWYLVAHAPKGLRTYRVSRMESVSVLAATFERPRNFDLAKHWKASTTELQGRRKPFYAVIAMDEASAQSIKTWCATEPVERKRNLPNGWRTLRIEFENEGQARFFVLGLGPRAQALEPASLRTRVLEEAKAIVREYGSPLS